ncbi:MAG: hypothetical protein HRT89_11600 [Lentisphaeria bacterium]|nr:hypothetical protein [Lentisphaeria bacterium]NQZ68700.1 hypothetical protein [Lentisphaeria bacterium]
MGMVLWANTLIEGKVSTDENDKFALYKHSDKLDKLSKQFDILQLSSLHDFTDMKWNMLDDDLPNGIESTTDLMAQEGIWVSGDEAVKVLESLLNLLTNDEVEVADRDEIFQELEESLVYAKKAKEQNGKFNYSVVM